jgi:hypothetical protein
MKLWKRVLLSLAATAALAGSFSCMNVFSPIDKPHGDGQYLSAARAAFDRGDISSAREYYGKVTGDQAETAKAEEIFLDMDACGADIDAFATALAGGASAASNPGIVVTVMGEKMNPHVSTACFATLLQAYKSGQSITNASLRGFVSFLATIAITGEILGTNNLISVNGQLQVADLYQNPTTCKASCAQCAAMPNDGIGTGASAGALAAQASISANWGDFQRAMIAAEGALTDLGIVSGPSYNLINSPLTSAATGVDNTYRCALAQIGVGR